MSYNAVIDTNRRKPAVIKCLIAGLMLLALVFSIAACSGVNVDPSVKSAEVNDTPENVCRAFFQSIYTDDRLMFNKCFHNGIVNAQGEDAYAEYRKMAKETYEFLGTQYMATRPCDSDNGLDYDVVKGNISFFNDIPESTIESIKLVSVKIYFKDGEENKSIEIYSITYEKDNKWYFFSMVDTTARSVLMK